MTDNDFFRSVGDASGLDEYKVVPYYLSDLKQRVSVTRVDGAVYAFDDLCPEHSCPLSAGLLTGTTIMCQCGGCSWDVTSGALLTGPAKHPLVTHPVRIADDKVEIQV